MISCLVTEWNARQFVDRRVTLSALLQETDMFDSTYGFYGEEQSVQRQDSPVPHLPPPPPIEGSFLLWEAHYPEYRSLVAN